MLFDDMLIKAPEGAFLVFNSGVATKNCPKVSELNN